MADGITRGLDSQADFALDERLVQCSLGGVVVGLDSGVIQECLEGFLAPWELLAAVPGLTQWCSLLSRQTEIRHPLQSAHEMLAHPPAAFLELIPTKGGRDRVSSLHVKSPYFYVRLGDESGISPGNTLFLYTLNRVVYHGNVEGIDCTGQHHSLIKR